MHTFRSQRLRIKKNYHEREAWQQGSIVCGIDEVGRGCLAGPIVIGAVILPPFTRSTLLKDSKQLTRPELLKGYDWIISNCNYALSIIHHRLIDKKNIYQATLSGMKRALYQLLCKNSTINLVLVDAMPLQIGSLSVVSAPFGEQWSSSIAAASILAKVTRDAIMTRMDTIIPGYTFMNHKGYSTTIHTNALMNLEHSIIHRKTFIKKYSRIAQFHDIQQALC